VKEWSNGVVSLYEGDARNLPAAIGDQSVHCIVTSPPYWGLRNYGLGKWIGGNPQCEHALPERPTPRHYTNGQGGTGRNFTSWGDRGGRDRDCVKCGAVQVGEGIGLEPTFDEWLDAMRDVGREMWRVLRNDGTLWLNVGDAYANTGKSGLAGWTAGGVTPVYGIIGERADSGLGLPASSLIGMPWRLAFAYQQQGWILRSAIVWHKPNPMPESVQSRPTTAYEMVFLFAKRYPYFYDAEAIKQPSVQPWDDRKARAKRQHKSAPTAERNGMRARADGQPTGGYAMANARNVWSIPTQGRGIKHFATFPDELARRCIAAGTSEHGVCSVCGAPWERIVERSGGTIGQSWHGHDADDAVGQSQSSWPGGVQGAQLGNGPYQVRHLGWRPTCEHGDAERRPATVLDPFIGSGTTAEMAMGLGRHAIGVELHPAYLEIAIGRLASRLPIA